jgi:cytochrome c oxidase cbb3-type subunit IV
MDVNDLRVLIMVLAFVAFVGIVVWAYSRRRKHDFEEAARLPFGDEDAVHDSGRATKTREQR